MARRQWSNVLWDGGRVIGYGQAPVPFPFHKPQIT